MKHLLLALVLAPMVALSSCAAVAVTGMAIVITDEWRDNALTADVADQVEVVWASTKRSLSNMTDALLHVDEDQKAVQTRIDNAVVVISVQQWDVDETRIFVEAKKYMLSSPEVSQLVMERIVRDLNR